MAFDTRSYFDRISEGEAHQISAGNVIRPWLRLGPFYRDYSHRVSGLTYFEDRETERGRRVMEEIVAETVPIVSSRPREGGQDSFLGEKGRWTVVRRPEKYLSWGEYNISNHLGAVFLATVLDARDGPGKVKVEVRTALSTQLVVGLNGRRVAEIAPHDMEVADGGGYRFELALKLGEEDNVLTLAVLRMARMTQMGFSLRLLTGRVACRVPQAEGVEPRMRAQLERELAGLSLDRELFYPQDELAVTVNYKSPLCTEVQLCRESGEVVRSVRPAEKGKVSLCPAGELEDGEYTVRAVGKNKAGEQLTACAYSVKKLTPTPHKPGVGRWEERRRELLDFFAVHDPEYAHFKIWNQVARYAGEARGGVEADEIREICDFIAARKDCADFAIQGLLRLMAWEQRNELLASDLRELMKETILGFKYWVDEPGATVMYMGSENHRLLFHVAEWLAGLLFPREEFTNSGQNGLYHTAKARAYITEWLRQRGRFGFDEWHSNSYFPVNIAPLLNLFDFAPAQEVKLRQLTESVLHYMLYMLAENNYQGVMGTTHGRTYGKEIKHPDYDKIGALCWLYYGVGSLHGSVGGMGAVSAATSGYRPPDAFARVAHDYSQDLLSRQRQGVMDACGDSARFVVYRTPDYMLSGLQDHGKGEFSPQTHVAQLTFAEKAVIFWSCPHTSDEGNGQRPDYWAGNTVLPRVFQHRNVLALLWKLNEWAWMSHCFLERARFDAVEQEGNWIFVRKDGGYAGIYANGEPEMAETGRYAGREFICRERDAVWFVECGRRAEWGSFAQFTAALREAEIERNGERWYYRSPSCGEISVGWSSPLFVQGEEVDVWNYPLIQSRWAHSEFGDNRLTIDYGSADPLELWFD